MADEAASSNWSKAGTLASVATAIVVVVGGISAAVAFIDNRFANREDVEIARCELDRWTQLLDLRGRADNTYARYVNSKVNIERLARNARSQEEKLKLEDLEKTRERLWGQVVTLNKEANTLAERFKRRRCDEQQEQESKQ